MVSGKKMVNKIANTFFNLLILNKLVYFAVFVKLKYILPRIQKHESAYFAKRVQNKGKDLRIHGRCWITGINNLKIGSYVRIGSGAYFSCSGGLTIGDNVQISRNVLIYTNNHDINSETLPYDKSQIFEPVSIGKSVWIGMNVVITPGTEIGDGAIIGMGTVVSSDVPKGAIVVGAKQRIIGYRDQEHYETKNMEKKYFGLLFPDS